MRVAGRRSQTHWRYKPLGVDLKSTITVNFELPKKEKPEKLKS